MKRTIMGSVLVLACACLTLAPSKTEPKAAQTTLSNPLVGAWKVVS